MPIDPRHVGKQYGPFRYELGLEKMREFASAISGGIPSKGFGSGIPQGMNPLLWDEEAARKGPYGAVIAFPTFAVNFAIEPFAKAVTDPALGINMVRLVHGEQVFEFFEVMRAGDVMTTEGVITRIYDKANLDFLVMTTESRNQKGELAVRGTWTAVIRN